jgi:hypothetical protein
MMRRGTRCARVETRRPIGTTTPTPPPTLPEGGELVSYEGEQVTWFGEPVYTVQLA